MVRVLFPVLLLVVILPPSHAADLCGFLDRVVASIDEKAPFSSVRYLDAPGGQCAVTDRKGHSNRGMRNAVPDKDKAVKESWGCIWKLPNTPEDDMYQDARAQLKQLRDQVDEASDRLSRARRKYVEEIDNGIFDGPGKREYRSAEREYRSIKKSKERASDRRDHLRDVRFDKASRELHSRTRKFLSSINLCIFEKKIRGKWNIFSDKIRYSRNTFVEGIWWTSDPSLRNRILVSADVNDRILGIEILKLK